MNKLKRPVLVAIIGYVLGIIGGLYFSFSMVPFLVLIVAIYGLEQIYLNKIKKNKKNEKLKMFSFKRYIRYIKLWISPSVIIVFLIFAMISNGIVCKQNKNYNITRQWYSKQDKLSMQGIICSDKKEGEYQNLYKIKVKDENGKSKYFYVSVSKKSDIQFSYGDIVNIEGTFKMPEVARNEGGFNYSQYLKQEKIIGTIKVDDCRIIQKKKANVILQLSHDIADKAKQRIKGLLQEDNASLLIGILLGDGNEIKEDTKEQFRNANLSHILAVSGMHITYLIVGVQKFFGLVLGKRKSYFISIFVILGYLFLAGFSPSLIRSGVMGICFLFSKVIYRKNDFWTSIAFSLLIILFYNPFLILDIGLQFSYVGVIGIVVGNKVFSAIFHTIACKRMKKRIQKGKYRVNRQKNLFLSKVQEILMVTVSAQISILPIMIYHFNQFYSYFLITNLLVSFLIGPVVMSGFILLFITILPSFLFSILTKLCAFIIPIFESGLNSLSIISRIGSIPFSRFYLATPKIVIIFFYYGILFLFGFFYKVFHSKKVTATNMRIRNLVALLRYEFRKKKVSVYLIIFIIIFLFLIFSNLPRNLKINFVDVGQGDCTFIETPYKKTILIDGGGVLGSSFSVGEKTLLPYLLDKGYTKIDVVIISHFDQDHVDGILTVLKEMEVKNVYISKQFEDSENYQKFIKIVKEKKIRVQFLQAGEQLAIEKNLKFFVMWTDKELIQENPLNNNSCVLKLQYGKFSCLFTGDIEKLAEEELLKKYKKEELKSTVLKVAHHGSKTSTTDEFLEEVNPKIAMIGVGKDNRFGHPAEEVIEKLRKRNIFVCRTDLEGEICLNVSYRGGIKIKKFLQ